MYVLVHGLAPVFLQQLANDVNDSNSDFAVHYDETTTDQVKKQLDLHIRYYCNSKNQVVCRIYKCIMFGHGTGNAGSASILTSLEADGFNLKHLLALGADGPNVNKTIFRQIQMKLKEAGFPGLLDIGSCNIHVVHNAFRKAVTSFGSDVEDLLFQTICISLRGFKDSSGRTESSIPSSNEACDLTVDNYGSCMPTFVRAVGSIRKLF